MSPTERTAFLQSAAERGLTLQEIGNALGVTRERARQLLNNAGINRDRKAQRRAQREAQRLQEALVRFGHDKHRAVTLLRLHGVPVYLEALPYTSSHIGGQGFRLVAMLGGTEVTFRHCAAPTRTTPTGPRYWRTGPIPDRNRPVVLLTPEAVHFWAAPIRFSGLYVRATPVTQTPWLKPMPDPDRTIPLA